MLISYRSGGATKRGQKNFHLLYFENSLASRTLDRDEVFKAFEEQFLSLTETLFPDRFILFGKLERRSSENYFVLGDTDSAESIYCSAAGEFFNPPKGKITAVVAGEKQKIPETSAGKMALLATHCPGAPFHAFPLLSEFVEKVPFRVDS